MAVTVERRDGLCCLSHSHHSLVPSVSSAHISTYTVATDSLGNTLMQIQYNNMMFVACVGSITYMYCNTCSCLKAACIATIIACTFCLET